MYMELIDNMKIIKKLKESRMGERYYSDLNRLVEHYAPILDNGPLLQDTGFTPHDFSHHCRDVYEILGIILPDKFYEVYSEGENLKLLLTAVLLHDIGMANDGSEESRRRHSELGREYVYDKMNNNDSALMDFIDLQLVEPLGDIIYAHSDIKTHVGTPEEETFKKTVDKYKRGHQIGTYEQLNIPYLAAILRLADELDISYSRIKGTGYEDKVNTDSSKIHYDICKYLKRVQRYAYDPRTLYIEVEEIPFSKLCPDDSYIIAARILDKYNKINREFKLVYDEVLSKTQYASEDIWYISRVELKDKEKYQDLAKKKIIPNKLKIDLKKIVVENDLLQKDKNWIDLELLFSLRDQCFMEPVSRNIYDYILQKTPSENGKMLIGVDYYGAILAAVIGYKFDIPFTYCFDESRYVDDIEKEIEDIESLEKLDLYVISDVIVSGKRIGRLLDILYNKGILNNKSKVDVVALFERRRKGNLSELYGSPFVGKIYILNDTFVLS